MKLNFMSMQEPSDLSRDSTATESLQERARETLTRREEQLTRRTPRLRQPTKHESTSSFVGADYIS